MNQTKEWHEFRPLKEPTFETRNICECGAQELASIHRSPEEEAEIVADLRKAKRYFQS